jgi:hypothetical protein
MIAYAIRRIALIIPTLFAIMVVNFVIVQAAPGGPVEQMISRLKGSDVSATERVSGGTGEFKTQAGGNDTRYRGARGLDPALIKELEKQYGFDKPPVERFWLMMRNYITFDFGNSFFRDRRVVDLIKDKLPVSISIGLWTTLITYLVSIPRHQESRARRLPVRCMDQRRHRRRLCGAKFSIRRIADRAVRRRQLSLDLPVARSGQRQLGLIVLANAHRRLFLAHRIADHRVGYLGFCDSDDADQELFS